MEALKSQGPLYELFKTFIFDHKLNIELDKSARSCICTFFPPPGVEISLISPYAGSSF